MVLNLNLGCYVKAFFAFKNANAFHSSAHLATHKDCASVMIFGTNISPLLASRRSQSRAMHFFFGIFVRCARRCA